MSDLKIAAEQILGLTDKGFEIIVSIFPDADKKRNFKVRPTERTASASIKLYDDRWKMTDFGGTIKSEDCFGLYAIENNISYSEAIVEIGRELQNNRGVKIFDDTREFYKYEFRQFDKQDFTGELNEQNFTFVERAFTKYELDILGPFVTEEQCLSISLHALESYSYYNTEKQKVFQFLATDKFPILAFINRNEAQEQWLKVYMPKGAKKWSDDGKDRRFRYLGNKPKSFVFGLDRVKKAFEKGFENAREEFAERNNMDVSDVKDSQVNFKLERVVLATGGSDALNFLSLGEYPIWFNSETEKPDRFLINKLKKYAKEVVLVPDADATGKRIGKELALEFLSVRTLWLDKFFIRKTQKDFKDYVRVNQGKTLNAVIYEVKKMLNLAMPAQFWEVIYTEKGKPTYSFHHMYAFYFLRLNGFCRIDDDSRRDGYYFSRVHNHIVEELKTTQSIKDYFRNFLLHKQDILGVQEIPHALLNMMVTSQKITDGHLANMHNRSLDFTDFTSDSQFFFLGNRSIKVTAKGIEESNDFNNYILKSQLIDSLIKEETDWQILPLEIKNKFVIDSPYFKISKVGENLYDIDVLDENCDFLNYLIQVSRMHWAKEREAYIAAGFKESDFYERSKFKIKSDFLSDEDNEEQVQHLVNKIFSFGYSGHRFKDPTKPWVLFAVDNAVIEDDVAEGGAGKSLFFEAMRFFSQRHDIDGKGDIENDKFLFEGVNQHTDFILFDDVRRSFNLESFFSVITSKLTINAKHEAKVNLAYRNSPKFGVSTNYSIKDRRGSSARRRLIMGFSDYYHASNEERSKRDPKDDFGEALFLDWNSDQWFKFLNFLFQSTSFYMSCDDKIEAPEGNILLRSYISEMGKHFQDWANRYIPTIEGLELVKDDVLNKMQASDAKYLSNITSHSFKKKMNIWCKVNGYEFKDRIIRNLPLLDEYNQPMYVNSKLKTISTEHICITKIDDEIDEDINDTNDYV